MVTTDERVISRIGNSAGVTLPADVLERLGIQVGDKVHLIETEQGILVSPYDPNFEEAIELARDVMRDYRDTLRALS